MITEHSGVLLSLILLFFSLVSHSYFHLRFFSPIMAELLEHKFLMLQDFSSKFPHIGIQPEDQSSH